MTASPKLWESFIALDAMLARAGILPTPPFWMKELERFYNHPTAQEHWARVGRGGIKSTTEAKCAINETVFGEWNVPRNGGERHWHMNISENMPEALARGGQHAAYLDVIGIAYDRIGEQILLRDRPLGLWTRAARVGALSGPRCIGWSIGEPSKLAVDGVNTTAELVATLRGTTVTHRDARGRGFGSAFGREGLHYDIIEGGDTEHVVVSVATSWEANPSVTEESTRRLEPNRLTWLREYASEPQQTASPAFEVEDIDRAFLRRHTMMPRQAFLVLDPSGLKNDKFAWGVARLCVQDPEEGCERNYVGEPLRRRDGSLIRPDNWKAKPPFLQFVEVGSFDSTWSSSAQEVVDELATIARRHNIKQVFSDQRESFALEALFKVKNLRFTALTWTNGSKGQAVERLRRWLADGFVALPKHEEMRKELYGFAEKLTPQGSITFGARGSAHDDHVALLITTAIAELEGLLPGDPNQPFRGMVRNWSFC